MARLPLHGVRILAVEQYGAGPWGSMLLADLGADVVKVENPETGGDVARSVPPYAVDGDSVYFQSFNRNKRSITLNLQQAEARPVLHRLVENSDAVFNNLRGDLPDKLGLTYQHLSQVKPQVVCCSLSAFGRTGRRAAEPGYDYLMQGYAGWMSITGEPGGPPQKSGLSLVDLTAGIMAALGLVSAVLRARETGVGGDVDVSLFDTALAELCYVGAWHLTRGYEPQRLADSSHPSQIPSQVLPSKDGWFVVMCAKEKFWQRLVEAMGAPELAIDPRFRTFADRLRNRDLLAPILKDLARQKTTAEWLECLRGQVPCAPVNSVAEALQDPQVAEDEMILEVPHPALGLVRELASPIKIADARREPRPGPALGEHTRQVLGETGFSPEEVEALYARGVL
jgi:crotonobetainyl-CoA:carnitine CoA-transferase CaiB-like acyl-CoA transferase